MQVDVLAAALTFCFLLCLGALKVFLSQPDVCFLFPFLTLSVQVRCIKQEESF